MQSLSPGIVETDFSKETAMMPENKKLQAVDVARACIAVLDTPPQVLVCIFFIKQLFSKYI